MISSCHGVRVPYRYESRFWPWGVLGCSEGAVSQVAARQSGRQARQGSCMGFSCLMGGDAGEVGWGCPAAARSTRRWPRRVHLTPSADAGRKLVEYEGLVSELLSSRFIHLAVTIPVSDAAGSGRSSSFDAFDDDEEWAEEDGGAQASPGRGVGNAGGRKGVRAGVEAEAGGEDPGNDADERLREELQMVVQGLLRLGQMERVLGVVQERVSEDLKLIIRCVLPRAPSGMSGRGEERRGELPLRRRRAFSAWRDMSRSVHMGRRHHVFEHA